MADPHEHVNLELIDAGDHADRVIMVLSKVKGLTMTPEESVQSTPCTIAKDVPRQLAEKLQEFLEHAGATVSFEQEPKEEEEDFLVMDDFADGQTFDETGEAELELDIVAEESGDEEALELDIVAEESEETELELDIVAVEDEELFSPDDLPVEKDVLEPPELPSDELELADDGWAFDDSGPMPDDGSTGDASGPSDDFGGFSAVDTSTIPDTEDDDLFGEEDEEFGDLPEGKNEALGHQPKSGAFQNLLSRLPKGKPKDKKPKEKNIAAEDDTEKKPGKGFKLPALPKFGKKSQQAADIDEGLEELATSVQDKEESAESPDESLSPSGKEKKALSLPGGPFLIPAVVGFLIGFLIAGTWGWFSSSSARRDANQQLAAYRQQLASQNQNQNQELEAKIQQQTQEIEALTGQNAELRQQLESSSPPQSITPSTIPDGGQAPMLNAMISSFENLKNRHLQSLEQSLEAQQQAACTEQVLLDGEGTLAYAQVIKQFSAQHTTFDILRSNSFVTPYTAELKVPFQQEIRTGNSETTCNNAKSFQILTPQHHEFGTYYGYWIIQYEYKDGKWLVNPTVIEKNRALYEKSFKVGSPDHAKFRIDEALFPDLKNQ